MTIDDEKLSAFLDGELPEQEMAGIRAALAEDEALAQRLERLALPDDIIASTYRTIDERPLPEAVTAMLATAHNSPRADEQANNVVAFPLWKRINHGLQQHAALAACLALVAGFVLSQATHPALSPNTDAAWQQVAAALDDGRSGVAQQLADGSSVTPQLSFVSQDGTYCRQYAQSGTETGTENIACNSGGDWTLIATVHTGPQTGGTYQTASGGSVLDGVLDRMIAGAPLSADQETDAIDTEWQQEETE